MKVFYKGDKAVHHHIAGYIKPGINDIPDGAADMLIKAGVVEEYREKKKYSSPKTDKFVNKKETLSINDSDKIEDN